MGFAKSLLLLNALAFLVLPMAAADIVSLVYKSCAKQSYTDSGGFQDALTTLLNSLSAQSSTTHFFKTSSGTGQSSVFGQFQCRGDVDPTDCNSCVSRISQAPTSFCGEAVAAQIQLSSCNLHYSLAGYPQASDTQVQYKTCSSLEASFEKKRNAAFSHLVEGIDGESGFYSTTYESVYVMGQCEGDLNLRDCTECLREALQQAEAECGRAISGQVYLLQCYVSYSYDPDSDPDASSSGSGQDIGKTVAAVIGGAFALFIVVSVLLFIRSQYKKT